MAVAPGYRTAPEGEGVAVITKALVCAVMLLCGCSSSDTGFYFRADTRFEPGLREQFRDEYRRQFRAIGKDPALVDRVRVLAVHWCEPQSGNSDLGGASCDKGCTTVDACVHAWQLSRPREWRTEYLGVGQWTRSRIAHEVCHHVLHIYASDDVAKSGNGHPLVVTIDGKTYDVRKDILGSAVRWPMNWLTGAIVKPDNAAILCGNGSGQW